MEYFSAVQAYLHSDYDQYYASLAASASASAQATPAGLSLPGSADFDDAIDDEEDVKPSIEYLDSLNDYRKRSRSIEDDGANQVNKLPRTGDILPGVPGSSIPAEDVPMDDEKPPQDDPMVSGTL